MTAIFSSPYRVLLGGGQGWWWWVSFLEKVRTKVYCCSLAEDRFPIHVPTLESNVREMLATEAVFSVNSAGHKVLPVILGTRSKCYDSCCSITGHRSLLGFKLEVSHPPPFKKKRARVRQIMFSGLRARWSGLPYSWLAQPL